MGRKKKEGTEPPLKPLFTEFPVDAPYDRNDIEGVFKDFSLYMRRYLKSLPMVLPPLSIENNNNCNGSYYIERNKFILHNKLLGLDHHLLRRIHCHYLLVSENPELSTPLFNHRISFPNDKSKNKGGVAAAIESATADYFACSFVSDPVIAKVGYPRCMEIVENKKVTYLRSLANDKKLYDIPFSGGDYINLGEGIGGVFWEIRKSLNDSVKTDNLVMSVWNDLWSNPSYQEWTIKYFYYTLITQKILTKSEVDLIKKLFHNRGFRE